jgi:hypothetical protein
MGAAVAAPKDSKDAPAGKTRIVPNRGACKVDGDCELGYLVRFCCQGHCGPRAVSKEEVARTRPPENCPKLCPPPAPCAREERDEPVAAVCQGGVCSTVFKTR